MRTAKGIVVLRSILLLSIIGGFAVISAYTAFPDAAHYLSPAIATLLIYAIFLMILKWQIRQNLFGDLGFLYLALAVAYTVTPAFSFLVVGLDEQSPLAQLLPAPSALGVHLWRHALFVFGVAFGYLSLRGRRRLELITIKSRRVDDHHSVVFLTAMASAIILFLTLMSAPVHSYYEHYIRYDHLSWFSRKLVSVGIRLNFGIYTVLLVFLFINYKKYRLLIPLFVTTICVYETVYSFGARIYAFVILLTTVWLYHSIVKRISLRTGLMVCIALFSFFSVVEILRLTASDLSTARDVLREEGLKPAGELGAVFLTSFHLYEERTMGALPPTEWPMFFADFISLVTFGDFTRWNPMDWYARNYFPDALVPPYTLGPIADSAIWGGELDLFVRALINGAFFAYLVRWFHRYKDRWWGVVTYVYCYASCVMTLKYSVFYILTPMLKTVLPTLLLVALFRKLTRAGANSSIRKQYEPIAK